MCTAQVFPHERAHLVSRERRTVGQCSTVLSAEKLEVFVICLYSRTGGRQSLAAGQNRGYCLYTEHGNIRCGGCEGPQPSSSAIKIIDKFCSFRGAPVSMLEFYRCETEITKYNIQISNFNRLRR